MTTTLTKQTFQSSLETRLFWGIGIAVIPALYWIWIISTTPLAEISPFAWLIGLGLIWLGWRWLAFLFQQITLTEAGLIVRQGWRRREVAYEDIFYARAKSGWFTGLTLVTAAEEIKIGRHIEAITELTARLEQQIPNLMTPRTRLPWRVPGNRGERFIALLMLLLFGGISLILAIGALGDGVPVLWLLALMAGAVAGMFGVWFLTMPVSYVFTEDGIEQRMLLQTKRFVIANLIALFRETYTVRTKHGRRRVQRVVCRFKHQQALKISQDQIGYPFEEFYTILAYHYAPDRSTTLPWPRQVVDIHHTKFAKGSRHDFRTYFQRKSQVTVTSIEEICQWLKTCQYIQDQKQFNQSDYWLHPVEFERRRRGDCEDHALWAWRKLVKLGYRAEFVVGYMNDDYHAWVMFEKESRSYILEAVNKNRPIINPVEAVQTTYRPDYGVDHNFVTYRYQAANNGSTATIKTVEGQPSPQPKSQS